MNIVELELDETLADFEIQDWIDNVFSVQFPEIKAKIKHGCSGICHKDKWHYIEDGDLPKEEKEYIIFSEEWGYEIRKFFISDCYFECREKDNVIKWKEIE